MRACRFPYALAIVGLLATGCRKPPAPPQEPAALAVDFAGCAAVRAGRLCVLDETRKITLFVAAQDVSLDVAGAPLASDEDTALAGGHRLRVTIPAGATELRISAKQARGVLRFSAAPPKNPHYEAARKLQLESAEKALGELATAGGEGASDDDRAATEGLRARIELGRGNVERTVDAFRAAIEWDRRAGRLSDEIDDAFALSYTLHQRGHRYAEARRVLDDVAERTADYPEGLAREPYYRAILASELGDRRTSLRCMSLAEERAGHLGMVKLSRAIDGARALELLHVGRPREAWDILAQLDKDAEEHLKSAPCQRVEHLINMGFAALAMEGEPDAPNAIPILEKAARDTRCSDRSRRASALGNLAEVAMRRGDAPAAKQYLKEAKAEADAPRLLELLAWTDVEGRIQLAESHADLALHSFDRELELARASALPDAAWRAHEGRGVALGMLGKSDQAIQALRAAESVLDHQSLAVPLGEGRSDYLRTRSSSAERLVDHLVTAGRASEALRAVVHAQSRILVSIARAATVNRLEGTARDRWDAAIHAYREARAALDQDSGEDWKYPSNELAQRVARRDARERALRGALDDALAALGKGAEDAETANPINDGSSAALPERGPNLDDTVAVIAWQKTPSGNVALVARGAVVHAVRLPRLDVRMPRAEIGRLMLSPLAAHLAGAKRLRVLPGPLVESVDISTLDYGGSLVADTFVVDHVIPLPPRVDGKDGYTEQVGLVVADPLNDLAESRREATAAIAALSAQGFHVRSLVGEEARSEALRSALPRASFFHYAGHGQYAGHDGWESTLPLASGGHLSIGEILALPSPPQRVILSGCETAGTRNQGLGLAAAFVIAGSAEVVGPTRPVSDTMAAVVSRGLYGALAQDKTRDLSTALAESLRQAKKADPSGDWSAFRALRR